MDRQKIGRDAEQNAEKFLQRQGLKAIARNYRCPQGEIDLIMQDRGELVFVEVRKRTSHHYGGASESVDFRKQQKLIRAANHYLQSLPQLPNCRFDVIAFEGKAARDQPLWYKDAFRI